MPIIDIRAHGGTFGGGKYRKGTTLGGFGGQAIVENSILLARTVDSSYGMYRPSVNLKENYIFFVGGNAQNVQLSKFDLTTGNMSWGDMVNQPEGSLVDKNGNSYVIFRDYLRRMNPNLVGYVWHVNVNMIGYSATRAKGGIYQKENFNSTSTHLYFSSQWSPYYVHKIDIATGNVTNITPAVDAQAVSAFEVHEDLNAIFAIKGKKLMKLDLNWNIIWAIDLNVSTYSPDANYSNITIDKKNSAIFAIWGTASGSDRFIWKVDYNGNIIQGPINITNSPYNLPGSIATTILFRAVGEFLFIGVSNNIYGLKLSNLEKTPFIYSITETAYDCATFVNNDTLHVGSTGNYRKYLNRIQLM
jgi:hypothetical protein